MAKPKKPLTDRAIQHLKPPAEGKRRIVWDALIPSLGVRITDRGVKSFVLVTRYPGSPNPSPRSLGVYGAISLEAARTKARGWIKLIGDGVDPTQHAISRRAETFQAISTEYFLRKAAGYRTRAWAEAAMARLVYPVFGSRPIETINRSDIVRLLDRIEDERGPVMANRALGIIGRIMSFHASRSDDFRSPIVKGMAKPEQARARVLSDDELRAIWKATIEYEVAAFGAFLRFVLLTATRRNEAGHMHWTELDGKDWVIPASRYKTNHDHLIPLSALALEMLPERQSGEFVFGRRGGHQPAGSYDYHKAIIDEASGVKGWVLHDLRRTARSLLSRAGVASDHAERCLGHVIGGVRGIYDRHEYYDEKTKAFEALATLVQRIIDPQQNVNVVEMKR
jgi:integrase